GSPPTPRGRVGAERPAVSGARCRRGGRTRRLWAQGTRGRLLLPRARFAHRQRAPLEGLMVEAAGGLRSVRAFLELDEGERARLARVAVRGQREGREGTKGGEVRTQLRLAHVIRQVANKQAHRHARLLLGEEWTPRASMRRVAVSMSTAARYGIASWVVAPSACAAAPLRSVRS